MSTDRRRGLLAMILGLAIAGTAPATAPDPMAAARASLPEFVDFLKLPNITVRSTAEIRHVADWLEAAFRRHGWQARQLADGETPMVFAEWPARPGAPTILFYAHMDGQSLRGQTWAQPDPFAPVLRHCADPATCATLPLASLAGLIDPDWRLFARSAADDKAPIFMMIAALDALRASGQAPAVNVKLIVDSHEELGGTTLKDVVARNADLLKADGIVMLDGPMHVSNRPTLVLGHRGIGMIRITVWGPRQNAHSGHYGNYAPNPAQRLARLLASFRDDDGHILIPGFDDGVDPVFAQAALTASVPDDEPALRRQLGIAGIDRSGDTYRAAMARPTLNIVGLGAGSNGATDQSIIPDRAVAALDIRTVPGIIFAQKAALVRGAVERAGFHLVAGSPSEADRATYPRLATVEAEPAYEPLFTDPASPFGAWARAGLGPRSVVVPIMGGSVPSAPLVDGLKRPAILLPLVNGDDNQHAANENLRLGNYLDGVRELVGLLRTPLR